jgi:hypothetical protein
MVDRELESLVHAILRFENRELRMDSLMERIPEQYTREDVIRALEYMQTQIPQMRVWYYVDGGWLARIRSVEILKQEWLK